MLWRRFTTPMRQVMRTYATDAGGNPRISSDIFQSTPGAQSAFWLFIAATLGYMFFRSRDRNTYRAEEDKKVNHDSSDEKPRILKKGTL